MKVTRGHLSGLLFWVGVSLFAGLGANQLWKDGSFWMDEASVAMSLLEMEPSEFIGPLRSGQSFPRLYLLLIAQLQELFGYRTMILRLLPYLFFVAGTVLWLRLFRLRLGASPLLLCLAIVLQLVPSSWLWYSAMLKQYTFDVFVALIPFSVPDSWFEESLGNGRRVWKVLSLALFCALSYSYALALSARVAGWYLGRLGGFGGSGLREGLRAGRYRLSAWGVASFVGGVTLLSLSLYLTDLRYTLGQNSTFTFWERCILARAWGDWGHMLALLDRFAFGWYRGPSEFSWATLSPIPMAILRIAFCLGVARIVWSVAGWRAPGSPEVEKWGTRSIGCLLCACGLVAASFLVEYPICAGRLTLFAACSLQIVLFEGMSLVDLAFRRLRFGGATRAVLATVMIGLVLPAAIRSARRVARSNPPENIRPLARLVRERSNLPLLVLPCAHKQVRTLPEGLGDVKLEYLDLWGRYERSLPAGGVAWVLDVPGTSKFCRSRTWKMDDLAITLEPFHTPRDTARLYLAHFAKPRREAMSSSPDPPETPVAKP